MASKSYSNMQFGNKKALLETDKAISIKEKGGWFGLTHSSILPHYKKFKHILRPRSPFLAIERDPVTFSKLEQNAKMINDPRVVVLRGDLFDALFNSQPVLGYRQEKGAGIVGYHTPLFRYGHLDFCAALPGLIDECIEMNLRRLSKWWCIKSPFYLDITLAHRGGGKQASKLFLEQYVPIIFGYRKWCVEDLKMFQYKDSSIMYTAIYKFRYTGTAAARLVEPKQGELLI